jgi:RNA polymerase sigma-70 factor (ECF subfamily)
MPSHEELLERIALGDGLAFRQLYEATARKLLAIALAILRDRTRAEEVLQDAFARVWERAGTFDRAKGSAIAWLATITRRLAIDEMRRSRTVHVSIDDDQAGLGDLAADVVETDPIGLGRLKTCLEQLRWEHRHAVVLAHIHGLSHEELSQRLDRPVGTIKTWIFRGLANLRICIG